MSWTARGLLGSANVHRRILSDPNTLLLLRHLVHEGWADSASAAPILQLDRLETRAALMRLQNLTIGGQPIVLHVDGVPSEQDPAFHLSSRASKRLSNLMPFWAIGDRCRDATYLRLPLPGIEAGSARRSWPAWSIAKARIERSEGPRGFGHPSPGLPQPTGSRLSLSVGRRRTPSQASGRTGRRGRRGRIMKPAKRQRLTDATCKTVRRRMRASRPRCCHGCYPRPLPHQERRCS